ncbi:DUF5069 domain-containing protein [Kamptonema cortianum]|nr:DUF5069 domain-containing protein [Oscillatoria laete-virens]MDK3159605.1 DUF5069 domain-containing protein [Kamptonema cortianum]MDL5048651.1 DUF5069 domain-containing protein [Oscillatoria amoena NRMC-F 0135]MDL5053257.1 DUF5069 domain-containing protein [Oscillatoria laete-virens NRMC-F 0139]
MKNYDYQKQLVEVWNTAVEQYGKGNRDANAFFTGAQIAFLGSIGLNAREVYDFAEDYHNGQEPDLATFLMVHDIRRAYFLEVQKGIPSGKKKVAPGDLPAKTDEVGGIVWLPRIIPKAFAKLRGEMDPELMYGCGGDRRFFRENDIHPAEFLRVAWANESSPEKIIDWVEKRRASK